MGNNAEIGKPIEDIHDVSIILDDNRKSHWESYGLTSLVYRINQILFRNLVAWAATQ